LNSSISKQSNRHTKVAGFEHIALTGCGRTGSLTG
jgi:hypothetical protein